MEDRRWRVTCESEVDAKTAIDAVGEAGVCYDDVIKVELVKDEE
jgi:hypothetical protein